jgi:hypothetical protein
MFKNINAQEIDIQNFQGFAVKIKSLAHMAESLQTDPNGIKISHFGIRTLFERVPSHATRAHQDEKYIGDSD